MDKPNNGYVTWKALISILIGLSTIGIGLATAAWQAHESKPHHDAVTQDEMDRTMRQVYGRLDRIENKIDRVLENVRKP